MSSVIKTPITVLMPVYNSEKYIAEAMESILLQTFADFEFMIINDGCRDATMGVIDWFKDSRIKITYNHNQNKLELIATLNKGLSLVKSEFATRKDATDECSPERLRIQLDFMQSNLDIGTCGTQHEKILAYGYETLRGRHLATHKDTLFKNLYHLHIAHGTRAIRTNSIVKNQIRFDTSFPHAEYYDFFARLAKVGKLHIIQRTLYKIRHRGENVFKKVSDIQQNNSNAVKSTPLFGEQLIPFNQQVHAFKANAQSAIETYNDKPLVTVLLPVYNAEKYLPQAIESILNQTFCNFELLIINDGSTDKSLKVIESYKDKRIRVLNREQNAGLVKTLNIGLKEVTSEFIIRADADDICLPNRFEQQVRFMQENKKIGACGSWFDTINSQEKKKSGARYSASDETIRLKHLYQIHISHGTAIIRTSVLNENAISYSSDFDHAEDYDIFDRIGLVSKLANIQQVLYVVRLHDSNVSKTFNHVQKDNSQGVKRRIFKRLGINDISDEEILMYQELQHQNYKQLSNKAKKVQLVLTSMFTANEKSEMFSQQFFNHHLSTVWFHYCSATANSKTWTMYNSANFVSGSDLSFFQKIKFRLKHYLK